METEIHNKFENLLDAVVINLGKWPSFESAEVVVRLKHILTDIIQHLCQATKNLRLEGEDAPLRIRSQVYMTRMTKMKENTQQHWCIIALILVVNYQEKYTGINQIYLLLSA